MIKNFCLLILLSLGFALTGSELRAASDEPAIEPLTVEEVVGLVQKHCGSCHGVPPPGLMPKRSWPKVIHAMADLSAERTGQELIPPEAVPHIVAYYYGSSPEELPLLPYGDSTDDATTFHATEVGERSPLPMVIDIVSADLGEHHGKGFLICDAEANQVRWLARVDDAWRESLLVEVPVPSRTEVVDFDNDGDVDIVVATLGVLPPSDRLAGKVLILRQDDEGRFEKEILLDGVGRTTDARAMDVDGDGDLDLVVAVFGGGPVGEIAWLETTGSGKPIKHVLLEIPGTLSAAPVDLDGDGRMDFVSLIAQEYELVVAFMNRGQARFEQVILAQAPHPMYGFTGMKLADLDGDGDTDILISNGDALDTQPDPKPYHGVQWLENLGNLRFEFHNIARFYGAATAAAGDVDGDGDLDVVAGSWLNFWDDPRRQSLVWFENDGKKGFSRRDLLNRPSGIVSLALADATGDDRVDIVAGVLRLDLLTSMMAGEAPLEPETRMLVLESKH